MTFDFNDYTPQPKKWFSTKVQYKGHGRAEFSQPKGWIEGDVKIHFDETGGSSIEMKVTNYFVQDPLDTEHPDFDNFLWLLNGRKPNMEGPFAIHFGGSSDNVCVNLTVKVKEGIFQTLGNARCEITDSTSQERQVHFNVSSSIFNVFSPLTAKYWVMPLTNFVSDNLKVIYSHVVGTPLYQHPLLFWSYPTIPDNLEPEDKKQLIIWLNNRHSVAAFGYNSTWAFIEPLFDYRKREKRLLSSTTRNHITSVMVGEIGDQTIGFEALKTWIPIDLLHLLSLSIGSLVGTPWIEFRDANGDLVQRIHSPQWNNSFHKGHTTLRWNCKGGISHLLTIAPNKFDAYLRTALLLAVKGSQEIFDAADSLNFFFRAFDTLTKEVRHIKQVVNIQDKRRKAINDILLSAGNEIKTVADQTAKDEKAAIKNIADIVSNADKPKRHSEAEGIIELTKSFGLNDFSIINDLDWWLKLYTRYRTQIIHEGFFSENTNTNNVDEIGYLYLYLHDLLLRLILKKLNYDGEYMSRIAHQKYIVKEPIDWVTNELNSRAIGIGRKFSF